MVKSKSALNLLIILMISLLFTMSACGQASAPATSSEPADKSAAAAQSSENESSATAGTQSDATPDIWGKYEEPVTLTAVRSFNSSTEFLEGEDWNNNIYTQSWLNDFNIKVEYLWNVPESQYDERLSITIASGDIPDFFNVSSTPFMDLATNDMLTDLTPIYDTFAAPLTKEAYAQNETCFNTGIVNGMLQGLGTAQSINDQSSMIWVRSDWLQKLNLQEPKTMDDLLNVARAFVNDDPDGNGINDTIGLAISKDFMTSSVFGLQGFFNGYHAYLDTWVDDGSGKLVYGNIQPEAKSALLSLQSMFSEGLIDKEFGIKDDDKVGESIASSKAGLFIGVMWVPLTSYLPSSLDGNDSADWIPLPLVSSSNEPAHPKSSISVSNYLVVSKDSEHPEAVLKLLNFFIEKSFGDTADNQYGTASDGRQAFLYSPVQGGFSEKNLAIHYEILDAVKKGENTALNEEGKGYYEKITNFNNGVDRIANWGMTRVFYTPSSYDVIGQYADDNRYLVDGFYGADTMTMVDKQATLDDLSMQTFTNIIMGESIDSFDSFVDNWLKLGGEKITEEVNTQMGR